MNENKTPFNLLDFFALRHTQLSHMQVELKEVIDATQRVQAKVELNLTPREMKNTPTDGLPAYQVTAKMSCHGAPDDEPQAEPWFKVVMVIHAAYRQYQGEPMTFEEFARHHTTLARQIYPLLHQQIRPILQQLGLTNVNLPYDLVESTVAPSPPKSALH